MADTQGSWSFTNVTKNGVVISRTGTYKIGTTVAATVTGLSPTVEASNITVDDNVIKLDADALGESSVKITKGSYFLGFNGAVPGKNGIQITNPTMTVSNGTVTVKGTLEKGYTLASNAKSITYSARKENATLATIQGLDTSLVNGTEDNAGKVGTSVTDGGTTTFTEAVKLEGKTITLIQDALKDGKVTFKNNAGGYTFALSSDVTAPKVESGGDGWTVSGTTAKYKGNLAAGHTLSLDGKTVNYTGNQENKVLITVSGITKNLANVDTNIQVEDLETADSRYAARVVLSKAALATSNITVTAGYKLELDSTDTSIPTDSTATENIWAAKNKTTAVYKQVTPAYYSYDEDANKILYNKQADIQTYATISGLKSGFTVIEGGIEGIDLGVLNEGVFDGDLEEDELAAARVFKISGELLGTKKTVITGDSGYSIFFEPDDTYKNPETSNEIWSVSGTKATLKGNITAGWRQTDDSTITYVGKANNAVLATVSGLAKNLVVDNKNTAENKVGDNSGDEGAFVEGLVKDGDTFTISKNVLGTTNVTFAPAAGFNYTLELDNSDTAGGAVPTSGTSRTFWVVEGVDISLKDGKEAYYTLSGNTLTYKAPVPDSTVATITGLKTTLKADSNYEIENLTVNGKKITVGEEVLDGKDVTLSSSGYTFTINNDLKPSETVGWKISDNVAYLNGYTSAGYTYANNKITYASKQWLTNKSNLAILTGLKKNLTVKDDGSINGIAIDNNEITLSKNVLATNDVTLTGSGSYTLALDTTSSAKVAESAVTHKWSVTNTGKATDKVTTSAGYVLADDSKSIAYKKSSTVSVIINGLKSDLTVSDTASTTGISGITIDTTDDTVTLGSAVLDQKSVTITGGDYKLVLNGVTAPTVSVGDWTTETKKNVTTATLNGTVSVAGYQASADGKTVNYFQETATPSSNTTGSADEAESTSPESIVLATITGLNGNVKANDDGTVTGITPDNATTPTKFTLSANVLGTSKIAISGGAYKLALETGVQQELQDAVTEWVTSGTTATYKKYARGYYTLNDTKSSIAYTAPTKGTTYATVKGIASTADLNTVFNSDKKTVTLNTDQLNNSKVTITGTGYKLALGTAPQASTVTSTTGWVTSGTTATYKTYTPGYYTKANDTTINYTAATKGTTHATIKGLASGAEIGDSDFSGNATGGTITLGEAHLGTSKVTLSAGDGFKLALSDDVKAKADGDPTWNVTEVSKKGTVQSYTATYDQTITKGYTLAANEKSITYAANETTKNLAKITGLAATANEDSIKAGISAGTTAVDGKYTITLSDKDILGKTTKLTSTDYVLGINGTVAAPSESGYSWTVNKSKGTAAYKAAMSEGYTLSADKKTLTEKAATTATIFTISGLNKNETNFKALDTTDTITTIPGIAVDTEEKTITLSSDDLLTKKVSLAKNDPYTFVLSEDITKPTAYTSPKWFVSTVKGTTTATLKDGVDAGYELANDDKNIVLTAEQVGDAVLTITGLKKGLAVSTNRLEIGIKEDGEITNGISVSGKEVTLNSSVLGTSDIALEGTGYKFTTAGGSAPGDPYKTWTFNKGTATYAEKQNSGYTLSSEGTSIAYTPAKTTTIATLKGLLATYDGNVNNGTDLAVNNDQHIITIGKEILGTSKVTVSVPKNSTAYTLNLAEGVPEQAEQESAKWVINGTTAQYKDYETPYYTVASGSKAINYIKAKDTKVYATVKGLKSYATIDSNNFSGDTTGGTITLDEKTLGTTKVTLTPLKGTSFKLALKDGVATSIEDVTETTTGWVTSGTTATYKTYTPGYYTQANNTTINYTKGSDDADAKTATIKGVKAEITGVDNNNVLTISGDKISKNVTVNGNEEYSFKFTEQDANSVIVGSDLKDTIKTDGSSLSISTAKGDDSIVITGDNVSVTSGAGDDTIDASSSSGSNLFIFAKNQGADVITGFKATDAIKTTSGTPKATTDGTDVTITLGTGTISLSGAASLGTITINGKSVTPTEEVASNVLLADDNYSMDAAQLSEIVSPFEASFTPYDFNSNFSLTKEESYIPQISYAKDK